jgi:hypothetical protein
MANTDPTGYLSIPPDLIRGVSWKQPCRVATTANITISTALNNGDSIDGVTLATGDRVVVKDQTTGSENGIYVVGATPVRAFDMDQDLTTAVPAEEIAGAFVWVLAGTVNAGKLFHTTNTGGGTIGSTTITWTEFSAGAVTGFATPAVVLGTAAAAGSATTVIRSDSTIVAFDATAPTTSAIGDSAATGSVAKAARRDHVHGREALSTATPLVESGSGAVGTGVKSSREDHVHPAAVSTGVGPILISDTPAGSPLVFGDLIQNEAGDDLVYADI